MRIKHVLSLLFLLSFSSLMFGQSATTPGKTSVVKVPMVAEPFPSGSANAPAKPTVVAQPSLEDSMALVPAAKAGAATSQTAQAQSLTAPGPTLGGVFDVAPSGLPPDSAIA